MDDFTQTVTFTAAYDKRSKDPMHNYGVHGVNVRFLLHGPAGAVQFVIYTNWHLPNVQAEMDSQPLRENRQLWYVHHKPMAADLGYHSPVPRYRGQQPAQLDCPVLGGKPCYYDGSGLNAEPVFEALLREGDEGVWRELRSYYARVFGEVE
jgi:hypothetical protein